MDNLLSTIANVISIAVGAAIFAATVVAWFHFGPLILCAMDGTLCGR